MLLTFNGRWRFEPPNDTDYVLSRIPAEAVKTSWSWSKKLAPQGDRWDTLESFKRHFVESTGATHSRSSALRFAEHDRVRDANVAAANAPLFIEAFFDACLGSFVGEDESRYARTLNGSNADSLAQTTISGSRKSRRSALFSAVTEP